MSTVLKQPARTLALLRLPVSGREEAAPQVDTIAVAVEDEAPPAACVAADEPAPIDHAALQAELDVLREQARREGLAEGLARAEQALKDQRDAADAEAARWRSGIEAMQAELPRKLLSLEPLAVAIGYEALARVLGRAYADGSGIEHLVRQLLNDTAGALTLRVQVAPGHLQRVQAALAQQEASASTWQFEADAALGENECRIVSERGQLETSLALQLDAVRDALLDAAGKAAGSQEGAST